MKEEAFSEEKYDDAQALEDDVATGHNGERGLQRNLKARHLAMISLGMFPGSLFSFPSYARLGLHSLTAPPFLPSIN